MWHTLFIILVGSLKAPHVSCCIITIVHEYAPFTRKQIVSLSFGLEVRTRLEIAISEVSGPLSST